MFLAAWVEMWTEGSGTDLRTAASCPCSGPFPTLPFVFPLTSTTCMWHKLDPDPSGVIFFPAGLLFSTFQGHVLGLRVAQWVQKMEMCCQNSERGETDTRLLFTEMEEARSNSLSFPPPPKKSSKITPQNCTLTPVNLTRGKGPTSEDENNWVAMLGLHGIAAGSAAGSSCSKPSSLQHC